MGIHTTGSAVKNHISSEMARELIAKNPTMCHLWFLVYQRVLPQLHLHLLLHHENPVPERSGRTSEELRGDPLHESTETENKNKNEEREEVQRDILPDWLQEFRENLVDENVLQSHGETLRQRIKTLPVLLMNYLWSREQQ